MTSKTLIKFVIMFSVCDIQAEDYKGDYNDSDNQVAPQTLEQEIEDQYQTLLIKDVVVNPKKNQQRYLPLAPKKLTFLDKLFIKLKSIFD